jgi:hypothetical protein
MSKLSLANCNFTFSKAYIGEFFFSKKILMHL